MGWWTIIKLKGDIDFTSQHHRAFEYTGDPGAKGIGGEYIPRSNNPDERYSVKIYLGGVRRILEYRNNRKATDKELMEEVISVIRHETGHAAHDEVDPEAFEISSRTARTVFNAEFIAFTSQYNDQLYTIYWSLMHHPGSAKIAKETVGRAVKWAEKMIPDNYNNRNMFGGKWGNPLLFAARDKLLLLYMTKVKTGGDAGIFNDLQMTQAPKSRAEALSMFGQKEEPFIRTLKLPSGKQLW